MNHKLFLVLFFSLLMGACAKVTVTHVPMGDTSPGVHFLRPRPYLLVSAQGKDLKSEILWLPDHSQEYVINANPGLGKANLSVKLKDGWMLTDVGAEADARVAETLTALGNVLEVAKTASSDPVGLYRIDIDPAGNVKLVKQDWMNP